MTRLLPSRSGRSQKPTLWWSLVQAGPTRRISIVRRGSHGRSASKTPVRVCQRLRMQVQVLPRPHLYTTRRRRVELSALGRWRNATQVTREPSTAQASYADEVAGLPCRAPTNVTRHCSRYVVSSFQLWLQPHHSWAAAIEPAALAWWQSRIDAHAIGIVFGRTRYPGLRRSEDRPPTLMSVFRLSPRSSILPT